MNYNELIQLFFERSTAMQAYWNLYVLIVGGLLAFSPVWAVKANDAPIVMGAGISADAAE